MPLLKNTAGQKLCVQARDGTGAPVTGDAANISCKVAKDHGALAALGDASPVELESGYYVFDLTQAETNADHLLFVPVSSSGSTYVRVVNRANGRTDGWSPLVAARLDTTVSSRLRADGYNPPDNAGIAAVRARTDNLPDSPAATGDIPTAAENRAEMDSSSTQLAKLGVPVGASLSVDIAAGKAVADAIQAKTDNLPANPADVSDVPTAAQIEAALINEGDGQQLIDAILTVINSSLDVPALELAAIAGAVRGELATELGRLDAAVSSRLAAAGYTAPDNAGISTAATEAAAAASSAAAVAAKLPAGGKVIAAAGSVATDLDDVANAANNANLLASTTIATLTSQTVGTLDPPASDDDGAYDFREVVITDQETGTQKWAGAMVNYVGATKQFTLNAAPAFEIAVGDSITILASKSTEFTDIDAEPVPNERTFTLEQTDALGLTGDAKRSLTAGETRTFAADFRKDVPSNGRIASVLGVAVEDGTSGGVTFGAAGRFMTQAKIPITGVIAGSYVIRVTVTYNDGSTASGDVTLEVAP